MSRSPRETINEQDNIERIQINNLIKAKNYTVVELKPV